MKKVIIFILIVAILGGGGYFCYKKFFMNNEDKIKVLEVEEERAKVSEYFVYGTYLSMEGSISNVDATYEKVDFVLYDGEFKSYELEINRTVNNIDFSFSEYINRGLYLDDIEKGSYPMFIRFAYVDLENSTEEEEVYNYKYYVLENETEYEETVYYTMSTYNNKIVINSDNDYGTLMINVSKNKDKEIYDVVIDPGHGGIDGGALGIRDDLKESDITMKMALALKDKLEEYGYKVKLTREVDSLSDNDYFDEYNDGGRAVISHEVNAKYLFSLHLNSSNASYVRGFEYYTADLIDYTFISNVVSKVIDSTGMKTSVNKTNRIEEGVYTHNYSEREIEGAMNNYDNKGYKRYNVMTKSNYLYMIRETGGIMTGAYVDDSNPEEVGVNPYYDSNVGAEAYLFELGYLTNREDVDIILNKQDEYVEAIASSFDEYIKGEEVE